MNQEIVALNDDSQEAQANLTLLEIASVLNDPEKSAMLSYEEKDKLFKALKTTLLTGTKEEMQSAVVRSDLMARYDFIKVRSLAGSRKRSLYYKPMVGEGSDVYRPFGEIESMELVRNGFVASGIPYSKKKVENTRDTLELGVNESIKSISNRVIKMGTHTYWDSVSCRVETSLNRVAWYEEGSPLCFRRLFDAHPYDQITVDINEVMFMQDEVDAAERYIAEHGGEMDLDYDRVTLAPFWTWADENKDTFNDLLKAAATNFFWHKPKGSFVLIGETRNGKSSYIKMLHTMFGSKNTSKVELAALSDPHRNLALATTMLNAPDEEADGKEQDTKEGQHYFKSMSSHDPIELPVMYSQEPQPVSTNFMGFYPMNKMPEWSGDGVQALTQRTLPLFFTRDLSNYDNGGKDFEKETYTAKFYSRLLPILLGFVKYYRNKPIKFSDTLYSNRETVKTLIDPFSVYLGSVKKYFHSVGSLDFVINDYICWMKTNGYTYDSSTLKTARQRLQRLRKAQVRYLNGKNGEEGRKSAYWFIADPKARPDHRIKTFMDDGILAALGDMNPIEYRQSLCDKGAEDSSIISVLDGLVEDGLDPIAMQEIREKNRFADGIDKVVDGNINEQEELEF